MHKLLLLTTYIVSALATIDPAPVLHKRQSSDCPAGQVKQPEGFCAFVITVGSANGTSLRYFPDNPQIPANTIVQFEFMPKNHTVTESSFAEPCKPISSNLTSETRPGLKTGFVPVTGTESQVTVFRMRLNDTKPMWLYCGQATHCQKGMVMVINQNVTSTDKTLDKYREKAAQVGAASPSASPSGFATGTAGSPATSAVVPVTPPTTTDASGPALAPSATAAATSPIVSVFNGGAAPTQRPIHLAALGGLAVAGAVALL